MKEKVLVLGAGGHCRVVLDILLADARYHVAGLIADQPAKILGIPVVGSDSDLPALYSQGLRLAFVGIGDNATRQKLMQRLAEIGFTLINALSPHAIVSEHARLGTGNAIMPGAVINCGAIVGNGCIINTNASIDHDCKIADYVHIAPGCAISGHVCIGEGSFVGTGANVVNGIAIGSHSLIGSGAAVVNDIPSGYTAVGVPAKVIKHAGGLFCPKRDKICE